MSAAYFSTTLGLIPCVASRAILPVFMPALLARLGSGWSFASEVVGAMALQTRDDFGVERLLMRLDEGFGALGTRAVFLLPALAAGAALGAGLCGVLLAQRIERSDAERLAACDTCRSSVEPCAPHCPTCRTRRVKPNAVGLLGRVLDEPAGLDHAHSLRLHKRCSYCGTRLRGGVDAVCTRCGQREFTSQQAVEAYLQTLARAIPLHLTVLAALGAVPVFGLFAGVLYARSTVVAAVRQYTPRGNRILGRWVLRLVNACLLLLQPIPVLGVVVLPLMALANVWFDSAQVKRSAALLLKPKDYSETLRR